MMPTELLCGSKTAAIAWVTSPEGIVEKRVYFQDLSGHIRESRRTANYPWRGGTVDDVVGRAKPFSPLAAIVWNTDVKKGRQV